MSLHNVNVLAVIPARGGSKGITGKNLREINGKSLIGHAAQCVQALDWVDALVLSTDSDEIQTHAQSLGIDTPFMRPADLAGDHAKSIDMWKHAWLASEQHYKKEFAISVLLEPTSPLRTPEDIRNAVDKLITTQAYTVTTVSKTPGHYTPHKTLTVSQSGLIEPYLEDGIKYSIRQEIPEYFHRNGICYATTRESLVEKNNLMQDNCIALVIDRPIVNIDEEVDLILAQALMTQR